MCVKNSISSVNNLGIPFYDAKNKMLELFSPFSIRKMGLMCWDNSETTEHASELRGWSLAHQGSCIDPRDQIHPLDLSLKATGVSGTATI